MSSEPVLIETAASASSSQQIVGELGLPASISSISSDLPVFCNAAQSEIYEISTRHLCDRFRSISFEQPNVEVNKWSGCRWERSDVEAALPTYGSGVLTIIYVHGNFMERNNALERVRIIDRYFKEQTDRPYRLLMLSWPSQREAKPLRDVLENAESAESQSLYFAWMLQRLRIEPQVSILGFSFGARSVTGGLHLDAGGVIPGFMQPPMPNSDPTLKYRVGLVAPAMDRNWIETNGKHQLAMNHVESMVNLYNSKDPILRRFRFMDRLSRPIAAGFAGFTGVASFVDPRATAPLAGQSRIQQYDCGSVIGTTHSEKSYYGECPYFRRVIQHLLWKESGEATCNATVIAP
ncbi:MAG: hypothetical protein NTY15_13880 [Planctomycetota bacterium]|nr:hypothetical protein [Planctomycetota bacterium]